MTTSKQIIKFGNGIVNAAKEILVDSSTFVNFDTTNTAIRYKRMAPIVIASRLRSLVNNCNDKSEVDKLQGFISELETAQKYGIDEGKCELINWSSIQSNNTIHASLGIYNLYSSNSKPVCDFVLISTTQQKRIDKSQLALAVLSAVCGVAAFIPQYDFMMMAATGMITGLLDIKSKIRNMITKEYADIMMLKTLEHYGLIRLIGDDRIELIIE